MRRADALARMLARVVRDGHRLVLVHGNGPQVGDALIRVESALLSVPPLSLDMCVAESQGSIGFLLERALRNALTRVRGAGEPVTLMTSVRVHANDPALRRPTKPVGPFFPRYRAEELRRRRGWRMVKVEGRGYRRVVPSPRPVEILGLRAIRALLKSSRIVIAAGGGGVPVVRNHGIYTGVEAVIDKDHTSALLARDLRVHLFAILTDVEGVYDDFGHPEQKLIRRLTAAEARRGFDSGKFPEGSMGPKVLAAADYARTTGRPVLITNAQNLAAAVAGTAGTRVVAK
jgi:carbamate kinase